MEARDLIGHLIVGRLARQRAEGWEAPIEMQGDSLLKNADMSTCMQTVRR